MEERNGYSVLRKVRCPTSVMNYWDRAFSLCHCMKSVVRIERQGY